MPSTQDSESKLPLGSESNQPVEQDDSNIKLRKVKSFVIRGSRMTVGQRRAYEALWPEFGLSLEGGMISPQELFDSDGPIILEIGFGMGGSLADMAEASPEKNFIGIEVHRPGVGALLMEMESRNIKNIRIFCDDAIEVLERCIPKSSLSMVQLFFPDPWHKKRHHKRRIVKPEFVETIRSHLCEEGIFHMATDWENYAEHMMAVMEVATGFDNCAGAGSFSPRPDSRPVTKFEKRGERLGHGVWDLMYRKL